MTFCLVKFFTVLGCFVLSQPTKVDMALGISQMVLDFIAGVALADLLVYHCYLRYKGMTTYEYILLKRKEAEDKKNKNSRGVDNIGIVQSERSARDRAHKPTRSETEVLARTPRNKISSKEMISSSDNLGLPTDYSSEKKPRANKEVGRTPQRSPSEKYIIETNIHTPMPRQGDYSFDYADNILDNKSISNQKLSKSQQDDTPCMKELAACQIEVKRQLFEFKDDNEDAGKVDANEHVQYDCD